MSLFKAYKGHKKTAQQVANIIARFGDYYPFEELLTEVPTEILTEWLNKNGFKPVAEMPKELKGVLNDCTYKGE